MALSLIETLIKEELPLSEQITLLEELNRMPITGDLLAGGTRIIQKHGKMHLQETMDVLDIVGTGGDAKGLFNISTTAAFVLAASGVPVIKHGGSGVSSSSGSVDLLKALGVVLPKQAAAAYHAFQEFGLVFIFAGYFHPNWGKLKAARQELAKRGQRTLFNLLGPLCNPFNPKYQALGVYDPALVPAFAEALLLLDRQGMVFSSEGCDELTLSENHRIMQVYRGQALDFTLKLADVGLKPGVLEDLKGGDPSVNATLTQNILNGADQGPRHQVVLLNALMGLLAYRPDLSLHEAWVRLESSLESGLAALKLKRLQEG